MLFIVDIATGAVIAKLDTGVGNAQRRCRSRTRQRLVYTCIVDINNDRIVDYVYAGDLFGNMWKFDLTTRTLRPGVRLRERRCSRRLMRAGNRQPITVRPEVIRGPAGAGMVVCLVQESTSRQLMSARHLSGSKSFYGIIDRNTGVAATIKCGRTNLTQQTIDMNDSAIFPIRMAGPLPIRRR